jgi:hypothetical protein
MVVEIWRFSCHGDGINAIVWWLLLWCCLQGVVVTMVLSLTALQFTYDFPPANYLNTVQQVSEHVLCWTTKVLLCVLGCAHVWAAAAACITC